MKKRYYVYTSNTTEENKKLKTLKIKRREIIFQRAFMFFSSSSLVFLAYIMMTILLESEVSPSIQFFFLVFGLAVWGVIYSILIKDIAGIKREENELWAVVQKKSEGLKNYETYKEFHKYARILKYESLIDQKDQKVYHRIKALLRNTIFYYLDTGEVYEEVNYILYSILEGENNGFHTPNIFNQFSDTEEIKALLQYVLLALRTEQTYIGLEEDTDKTERFFLALKKALEKRYVELEKEKKKEEREEKSFQKTAEDALDLENNELV